MSSTTSSGRVATFDAATFVRFTDLAVAALGAAREEIDALNVYPVPDGDTGTNMFLTLEAGRDALAQALAEGPHVGPDGEPDLRVALAAMSRGLLLGARGNSGVILSQLVGALVRRLAAAGPDDRSAAVFADGLVLATVASYAAVGRPVEGTILTVAKAASDAAREAAQEPRHRLGHVIRAAAAAAREALAHTPEQLQTLADAGVVDAGGRGLCVILDAAESAVTGRRPPPATTRLGSRSIPVPLPAGDLVPDGPAYEVMYLLDAADDAVPALRAALDPLGDSLVVVGGEGLWNVHVHVDDVGAALEAGLDAGRPHRVRVTHFAEQARRSAQASPSVGPATAAAGRAVIALAAGPGLAALFEEAGALVVPGGPGVRPSAGEFLERITASGAAEVVVLPNDPDSVGTAEVAARTAEESGGLSVVVIPTHAQVQGLAALAVHEPGRPFEHDLRHMTAAANHARQGAVTVAAREAMTMAGPCHVGDALGVVEGDFVIVGSQLDAVACEVLERLLGGGGELVTLVTGEEPDDLATACERHVQEHHPGVDVVVYDGGQPRYPLLMAVE